MTRRDELKSRLREAMRREATENILPFWRDRVLIEGGRAGFFGRLGEGNRVQAEAPRGGVLCARLLWAFSAAYRAFASPADRAAAEALFEYWDATFRDARSGGAYWMVAADGRPIEDRKDPMVQAFAIYGLAEHFLATGSELALSRAMELFELVESHSRDGSGGGYLDGFDRDWRKVPPATPGLRSLETHLHLMEAYTTLLAARPGEILRSRLAELAGLLLDRFIDPATGRIGHFFDREWRRVPAGEAYGHDLEASWLLVAAAGALGDAGLETRAEAAALRAARLALDEALDGGRGVYNRKLADGSWEGFKEWWPQAEAVIGFLNAYGLSGEDAFLEAAASVWGFINSAFVDEAGGEWRRTVSPEGRPNPGELKVDEWKCPYHDLRMCVEAMVRLAR
jgi:cellobiose epimerase